MLSSANNISIVMSDAHANQQRLDTLRTEYDDLKNDKKFIQQLEQEKRDVKEAIAETKHMLQKISSEFDSQKFTLLNKYDQLLLDLGDAHRKYIDITKQHIDYLETHIKNSQSDSGSTKKSIYSFSDLHQLTKKIASQEDALYELQLKKDEANASIDRLHASITAYEKQLKESAVKIAMVKDQPGDIKNDIALLDLEEECASLGKRVSSMEIDKHRKMIQFIDSRASVAQAFLLSLREDLNNVRMHLRIDITDVSAYEEKYNGVKRESQVKKADYIKQRNDLIARKKKLQDEFEELMDEFELSQSNMQQIEIWDLPDETVLEMYEAAQVADIKTSIATLDRKLDNIQVNILLEDSKIMQAKTEFDVISSLYSITQVQFKDNEHIDVERDSYKELQAALNSQLKVDKDNIASAHGYIKSQHKALSNIKRIEEDLRVNSRRFYREEQKQVSQIESALRSSEKSFAQQNSLSVKLSEVYTQVLVNHEQILGTINFIVKEFELAGVWHRSNRAITWKGVKLVIPNLILFASNIKSVLLSYFSLFTAANIQLYIKSVQPAEVFSFLFTLLLLFVLFVLLQTVLSYLHVVAQKRSKR